MYAQEPARPLLTKDDQIDRNLYERSLIDFTAGGWKYVEPKPFVSNWHIEAVCDHLEWVAEGEITRLLINIPPRHMKSRGANVFFPAWVWAQDPDPYIPDLGKRRGQPFLVQENKWKGPGVKFMHLSYDARLSMRDSIYCRQVIRSPWYQKYWGDRVTTNPAQDNKGRFDNMQGGYRLATSENGLITGEGGDIIIFDDPHNAREVDSDVVRDGTLKFWDESMPSRLNDQKRGVFIIIMQRLHERDLSGYILARELGWTHLCLPALYEAKHPYVFGCGFPHRTDAPNVSTYKWKKGEVWKDPRSEGEPLWPALFPLDALQRIAKDDEMSSHVAAGQLQQRPSAREGGMFKRDWFDIVNELPITAQGYKVRSWDLAGTADAKSDPDYSVGLLMARDPLTGIFYITDVIRKRLSPAGVEAAIKNTARTDGYMVTVRLPQDPGQAGKFQVRTFVTMLAGFNVRIEPEENSKATRAESFAAQAEVGNVKLLRGAWNEAFINEICAFDKGRFDDQVDAATGAYRVLSVAQSNMALQGRYISK